MNLRCRLAAGVGFCSIAGCGDSEEPRILRFCESRTNLSAIAAGGEVYVGGIGSPLGVGADVEPFVVSASESKLELELCGRPFDGDWHVMTTWHLDGAAPQTLGTHPPGSYFEGYSRGRLRDAPLTHNAFFTAGQEPLALPGEGTVEVYDLATGRFKATMRVNGGRDELGGAAIDLDISWVPR